MLTAALQNVLAGVIGRRVAQVFGPAHDITASGAVPILSGTYRITVAGVAALTIAAPTAAQVGTEITLTSATANAHVLTFTGNTLRGGTAAVATSTFAAFAGAGITLVCVEAGFWNVKANVATTLA